MDWTMMKSYGHQWFAKYKYVLLILALGLLLMNLPDSPEKTMVQTVQEPAQQLSVSEELEQILSRIDGVGRVDVMITEAAGAETHYQTDLDETNSNDTFAKKEKTVLHSPGSGETGLIRSVTPPVYLGAVIVCEGGGDPSVVLSVVRAVSNVTGISSDRISVLKMK